MGFLQGLAFFVGIVLTWAAATTGFGAVILTRGGGLARGFPSFRRGRRRGAAAFDDPDPFREAGPGPEVPGEDGSKGA
jgi:hypothetical protein